ncbi:MAG: HAD family acid phosphatase [Micropruina sp.]|uniref:5'-nucleotidase, lipoprotein e(P4) family n=1 Tax=Micropruina sp. TaxID=2737536 RepID=UPI0039E2DFF0
MSDLKRRSVLAGLAGGTLAAMAAAAPRANAEANDVQNIFSAAVAWRQTAAERDMLYIQGFQLAKARLDAALAGARSPRRGKRKKLAFISDVDDTVLDSNSYWALLLAAGKQAFDDALWDEWVAANGPTATPGAVDFTHYAKRRGVEVFYVSSRDQGEDTQKLGVANLKHAGLAFADDAHVTMLRESSNKEPTQQAIAAKYDVIAYLGDNLNDFRRRYYVNSVTERKKLAMEDAEHFGTDYILFPNNTDGHWLKAIFGDSEPADSAEYRATMLQAALGKVS